ncbi:MAG: PQQ-binding-like beta-propeller repeat protein [Candidatus Hodarchaeota archaeon]
MKSRGYFLLFIQLVAIIGVLPPPSLAKGRLGRQVMSISAGDIDGDGNPDVAVGTAPGAIYAIEGRTRLILWSFQASSYYVGTVVITDFNQDGIGDILAGSNGDMNKKTWESSVYAIDGSSGIPLWVNTAPVKTILSIAIGYLNDDEIPDVVVGSADCACYGLDGSTGQTLWVNRAPFYSILCVAVADFDGDRLDDAVAGSSGEIYAIKGLTGETLWINQAPLPMISSVATTDLNQDGIDDVVAGSWDTNVYAIDGTTGKTLWVRTDSRSRITMVIVGDFNGDQVKDVGAGTKGGHIYAFEGSTGEPLWINLESPSQILTTTVGDFNIDGIEDILVGSMDSRIYTISGLTGQSLWMDLYLPDRVVQVSVGDFNQDGVGDALAASGPNVYVIDGLTGEPLWNTIGFWEHMGQYIGPVTIITVGFVLLSLFILSWHRRRGLKEEGEDLPLWFGQGKLGSIYAATLIVVGALSWAVQKDWSTANATIKLWLSYLSSSFPTYVVGITLSTLKKSLADPVRLVKQVRFALLLLFAAYLVIFLYVIPKTSYP